MPWRFSNSANFARVRSKPDLIAFFSFSIADSSKGLSDALSVVTMTTFSICVDIYFSLCSSRRHSVSDVKAALGPSDDCFLDGRIWLHLLYFLFGRMFRAFGTEKLPEGCLW